MKSFNILSRTPKRLVRSLCLTNCYRKNSIDEFNKHRDLFSENYTCPTIAFIGAGKMGGSMIKSYIKYYPNDLIHVVDTDPVCLNKFNGFPNILPSSDSSAAMYEATTIFLAIKPQFIKEAVLQLKPLIRPDHIIVSIMAGINIDSLSKMLDHRKIVRAMPNITAQIGQSISVYYPSTNVTSFECVDTRRVLGACGPYAEVYDEKSVDISTAISGGGPAYIYYLAEHMCKAATDLGFDEDQARCIVKHTLNGSVLLWDDKFLPAETLRRDVMSPGGTTEEAINYFDTQNLGFHIQEGIKKSYKRAVSISKN